MKIAILAWGSLVWDPRDLKTAAEFVPNGPLLPIEFCRVSKDGRLTLAIDERFGDVCTSYSAPCALDDLNQAIENLRLREGTSASNIGFVEPASDRQSEVAAERHPQAVATIAAWVEFERLRRRDLDRAREQLRRVGQGRRAIFRNGGDPISRGAQGKEPRGVRPRARLYPEGAGRGPDAGSRRSRQALALRSREPHNADPGHLR